MPEPKNDVLSESERRRRRWGFLPPKVREEMLSATGKEPPLEYKDIVEKYYKRISDHYERMTRKKP